jgi:hypothetical protein
VKILCSVNQAECFRRGIDAPDSTVPIDVNPSELSQEERDFIADHLAGGCEFTFSTIVPPTYEGFIEAVKQGMEHQKNKQKTHQWEPPQQPAIWPQS